MSKYPFYQMKPNKILIFSVAFLLLGNNVIGSTEPYHNITTDLEIVYNSITSDINSSAPEYRAKVAKLRIFEEKIDTLQKTEKDPDILKKTQMLDTVIEEKTVEFRKKALGDGQRIAHAGGVYKGLTYTNSIESLDANRDYYPYFELDFSWTSDNHLVCIHDWGNAFKKAFGYSISKKPTYSEFETLVEKNPKFKNCTTETLIAWLDENPDTTIITDVKERNIEALSYIAYHYPSYRNRFIPQIYHPSEYSTVKRLGFKNVIWTLYRYGGSNADVLYQLKSLHLFAVTMPVERAETGLGKLLDKASIYSYVHTINNDSDFEAYNKLGVDEVYTDTLKF